MTLKNIPVVLESQKGFVFVTPCPRLGHADHELLIPSDSALVASTGFTTLNYRPGFDISLPMYNPTYKYPKFSRRKSSYWFILSAENKLRSDLRKVLKKLERTNSGDNYTNKLAVLEKCKHTHSTKRSNRCSSNKRCVFTTFFVQHGLLFNYCRLFRT